MRDVRFSMPFLLYRGHLLEAVQILFEGVRRQVICSLRLLCGGVRLSVRDRRIGALNLVVQLTVIFPKLLQARTVCKSCLQILQN